MTQDGRPQVPRLWLLHIQLPHLNPGDPRGTYHSGRYGHGVVQQGLGGLGAQEVLEVPEDPCLQGCLQLLSGQGALGVPVDLQLRTGTEGHMGGRIKTCRVVGYEGLPSSFICYRDKHSTAPFVPVRLSWAPF